MNYPSQDDRSDRELIRAANDGDAGAFESLYGRYRDWVLDLAFRFTRHEADALDVMQETFTYLLRKFPGFHLSSSMTTFLYPAVKNLSIAARKKRARSTGDAESLDELTAPRPALGSDRQELAEALRTLPEAQREVVLMRFVDGLSLEEIAAALDIPPGTVKSRLHNALAILGGDPLLGRYFAD